MSISQTCIELRDTLASKTTKLIMCDDKPSLYESIISDLKFTPVNPNDLTTEERKHIGFQWWGNSDVQIQLIPLWLYPFLVDEFTCCTLFDYGEKIIKRVNMGVALTITMDGLGEYLKYGIKGDYKNYDSNDFHHVVLPRAD